MRRAIVAITTSIALCLVILQPTPAETPPQSGTGDTGGAQSSREGESSPETPVATCNKSGTLDFPGQGPLDKSIRFGTIYTPANDSFVDTTRSSPSTPRRAWHDGTPDPVTQQTGASHAPDFSWTGDPSTGAERLRVQAHWWQPYEGEALLSEARVTLWSPSAQAGPYVFKPDTNPNTSVLKCYKNYPNTANLGYLDVTVLVPAAVAVDPGLEVRVEIIEFANNSIELKGADQNMVHVGAKPGNANAPVEYPNAALGAILNDTVLLDRNGEPDDLSAFLTPDLVNSTLIQGFLLPSLRGASFSSENDDGNTVFGATINDLDVQLNTFDWALPAYRPLTRYEPLPDSIQLDPFTVRVVPPSIAVRDYNQPADDESALEISTVATITGRLSGNYAVWVGPLLIAIIPFEVQVNPTQVGARFQGLIDISDTNKSLDVKATVEDVYFATTPNFEVNILDAQYFSTQNQLRIAEFLQRNFRYYATSLLQSGTWQTKINEALGNTLQGLTEQVFASLGTDLVPLPDGALGFNMSRIAWTCVRLGCQGGHVLLSPQGLEAAAHAAAIGPDVQHLRLGADPSTLGPTRFPKVYWPSDTTPVPDLLATRTSPAGVNFDVGVLLDSHFVNQILRVLAAGRLFELTGVAIPGVISGDVYVEVAPMFRYNPATGRFAVYLLNGRIVSWDPNAQFGIGQEFSFDLVAEVGLTLKPDFKIDPSIAITRSRVEPMRCKSQSLCGIYTASNLLNDLINFLRNQLINPLIDKSLGEIGLPEFGDLRVAQADVASLGGQLGLFVDVEAAPKVSATARRESDDDVVFSARFWPARLNPQYSWRVYDKNGDLVVSGDGPELWVSRYDIIDEDDEWMPTYRARGVVTVTTSDGKTYEESVNIAFRAKGP